jgi:agmatine deiminase
MKQSFTPAQTGFRMPAEWEPHSGCWMAWPTRQRWRNRFKEVCECVANLVRIIARCEPVTMAASPSNIREAVAACGPNVTVLPIPVDDIWIRDTGPTFLLNREHELAGTTWRFNAWGGKHTDYEVDATVASRILDHLSVRRFDASLVNEGGAFSVDGDGTVLTTESVLLNPNRNPGLSRKDVEERLLEFTGARKVAWLPGNPVDEITDGHLDGIAVFARPGLVITELATDPDEPDYSWLQENLRALQLATDARGGRFEILTINRPQWNELWPDDFVASYINFYIANGTVIVPTFGFDCLPLDTVQTIARAFPGRDVVQVRIDAIAAEGGGIHCVTQQQPAGRTILTGTTSQ